MPNETEDGFVVYREPDLGAPDGNALYITRFPKAFSSFPIYASVRKKVIKIENTEKAPFRKG